MGQKEEMQLTYLTVSRISCFGMILDEGGLLSNKKGCEEIHDNFV